MQSFRGARPQAIDAVDVATKVASLILPARATRVVDQARRDLRVVRGVIGGERPAPVREQAMRAANLDEIDVVSILPRRLAARVSQGLRDLDVLVGALQGRRPPPTVKRPASRRNTLPPPPAKVATRPLRVARVVRETPDAVSIYLEETSGALLTFEAGQFLSFDGQVKGRTYRRAYSLASAALEGHAPHVTVKRVDGGVVSNHLVDHAREGDVLHALGPSGVFTLKPSEGPRRLLLLAGGSGITPIISLAETTLTHEPDAHVVLLFGNRRFEDVIFHARLDAMKGRFGERLVVDHVLEAPPREWSGAVGRLDTATVSARLGALGVEPKDREVYVCGPTPMMDAAHEALLALGVPKARIHEERFTSPEQRKAASAPTEPQPVLVALGGVRTETVQRPGQTLLEAGLAAGLPMPFSCAMGGCAACKVRLVEGDVVADEPNCLTDDERAEGYVLACCTRATTPCTVEVP
ncbi:MAG: ferredoxin--NADP reductase [Myxococcales bacterium]|nr:ferredoxin--NADP reductase [Myxococcales bacterium]